jgi:hypothetical protein
VPSPDWFAFLELPVSFSFPPSAAPDLLAYFGLGPGAELIPYFVALMGFAGAAFLAVVQWPIQVLLRRFTRTKNASDDDRNDEAVETSTNEAPSAGGNDTP